VTTNEYPRLCGGTFFTLLLQARKQRIKTREHRRGERDGLSDTDMFIWLLKVFNPDYNEPTPTTFGTFKTNTSDFKSCEISSSSYLPLEDTAAFNAHIVNNNFDTLLQEMCIFVERFIDDKTSTRKATLDLVCSSKLHTCKGLLSPVRRQKYNITWDNMNLKRIISCFSLESNYREPHRFDFIIAPKCQQCRAAYIHQRKCEVPCSG
jgi:hypothetical protein